MAWTTPYTWTVGEILTAAKLQTYVSDNLAYIKAVIDLSIPNTGWVPVTGAWTYASASTITVPTGAASIYQKGDKIRLKQGAGYKYYYITIVADTLLTVTGGTDFTVANAAISDMYYSKVSNPLDFPHWFAYTATPSGTGGSIGAYAEINVGAVFSVQGLTCTASLTKTITNKGSWSGTFLVARPITGAESFTRGTGQGFVIPNASIVTRGVIYTGTSDGYFHFLKTLDVAELAWADLAANDMVAINHSYRI